MEDLPEELQAALRDLERDYEGFDFHPVGNNGYLVFARNRISGIAVAIKFYYGAPGERRHDEPKLLASIQSPNVLPIIDARNLSSEWAFFLTKRCGDGDLDHYMQGRPSARRAIDVALGVCAGASAIHASGLIHRDLKPANIVSDGGIPLIADFGSVRRLAEGQADLPASGHSALYRPPESFETGRYSFLGDVYQIGLVTYQLLGGSLPYDPMAYFSKKNLKEYDELSDDVQRSQFQDGVIHRRAAAGELMDLRSLPPWVRGVAKSALRSMTHPDVGQRLKNAADVAAALTRVRADTLDWQWVDNVARLELADRIIELRPTANGLYEPLQAKEGLFRRIPSTLNAPLGALVARVV
ncbi:protein kinase [Mesorhizobium sp. M0119]|uniref:protein kinase domain-containing protein n=1 Tax=Mesorhizobium sp. M0119 TaxID=2956885 RepID=UPI003336E71C